MFDLSRVEASTLRMLQQYSFSFELERFPSGAVMIDINLPKGVLLVVQLHASEIGLSRIEDELAAFDSRPDIVFPTEDAFFNAFDFQLAIRIILST